MKKILLIASLLISIRASSQSSWYYTMVNKQSDSTTQGASFYVDLILQNTIGADFSDSLKMMVYSNYAENLILSTPIKITFGGFGAGGKYGTHVIPSANTFRFTFSMPSYIGWVYLFSNRGFGPVFLDSVYLSSSIPDLYILNYPLSATSGDSIYFNVNKGTYKYSNTDSLKITIGTKVQETIAVNDIKGGIVGIKVNSNYGVYPMSFSGATNYSYSFTVYNSITSIVEPFDSSKQSKTINYYDILGRPATPKDGDMIRYTSIGAVVY